jgi:hypothetical protein
VLAEEFMKPLGLSARAWAQPSAFREMTEDEDIDAPTIEELKTLATLLWDFHPRKRLKGKKGKRFVNYLKSGIKLTTDRSLPLKEYVWAIAYGL